jgi:hypothetical protein
MKRVEIFVYVACVLLILKGGITPELKTQCKILCEFVVYAWSFGVVNLVFCGGALNRLGVRPRTQMGLLGIFSGKYRSVFHPRLVCDVRRYSAVLYPHSVYPTF